MAKVFVIQNPFNPHDGLQENEVAAGQTLRSLGADFDNHEWTCVAYVGGKQFFPLHSEWGDVVIGEEDCVYFMPVVGDPVSIIIIAIVAVAAVVIGLSLSVTPPSTVDSEQVEPDPVFDLTGQKNQNRLGHVIEDPYGRVRMWPSYGANAYNQYLGNNQFQYQLFCLGHGSYDIETIQIEDTEIDDFQEIEYVVYGPGEQVTLFPDNVETSTEVGSIELFGPNQEEFIDVSGPFVANSVGTTTTRLEVDVAFPQGLYFSNNSGNLDPRGVQLLFEYREINDVGVEIGDWEVLEDITKTLATNTPQRFTFQKDVPEGRYEVRAQRVNDADESARAVDKAQWVGMRAFLPSQADYGDKTMLAIKARATNNLNDRSSNRINVIATRKLPKYYPLTKTFAALDDYVEREATRSPIWAMANLARAKYAGNLADEFLDIEHFESEAAIADAAGIYFDWIYDRRSTVWEALKLPCFVNKAIPMLNGSTVSFVRDQPQTLPTFFINPENTVENSFRIEKRLFDLQEQDGLKVEYTESASWKPETVDCLLPGDAGSNMKRITIRGVTDRQRAYDLGMYLWSKERQERELVTLKTGLEGYIPTFGDLGRVGSDIPRWGQNGHIIGINGQVITLSEPVTFAEGESHQLAIRGKHGQDLGPYTVTEGIEPNQVVVVPTLPENQFFFDGMNEPPYFIFGISDIVGRVVRVVNLRPNDREGVEIKAMVDDQNRHADFGPAPVLNSPPIAPVVPAAPVVPSVTVANVPNSQSLITVNWEPAFGAVSYILEQSPDGIEWEPVDTISKTNYSLPTTASYLFVRVAAVNIGIGPWAEWDGIVGDITQVPGDVIGLAVTPAFETTVAHISWGAPTQATGYTLKILTDEGGGFVERFSVDLIAQNFDWTIAQAIAAGAVNRTIRVQVIATNPLGESATPAEVDATNPIPAELTTGISSQLINDTGTIRAYVLSWDESEEFDIEFYRVWGSEVQGFTPGMINVVYEGSLIGATIEIEDIGSGFPPLYWRVAAVDFWGDETNPSAEQTI